MKWIETPAAALAAKLKTGLHIPPMALGMPHFAGQHTNPERAKRRRAIKRFGGIRQFKKFRRFGLELRAQRLAAGA